MTDIETASREQLESAIAHLLTREARQLEALQAASYILAGFLDDRILMLSQVQSALDKVNACLGDTESGTA